MSDEFARLRARVLADPALQCPGADWSVAATPENIAAARRSWLERRVPLPEAAPVIDVDVDVDGWTPVHLDLRGAAPVVEWADLRGLELGEPFFEDSLQRAFRNPYRLLFRPRTGLAALQRVAEAAGTVPTGLLLHCSRCGSTLACSMLGATPGTLALSEPAICDEVLRAPGVRAEERARWLRWILAALARPGQRLVVKLDAWAALDLPIVRRALPAVPWAFLHRDPAEVIASQIRERGSHMVPALLSPARFGLSLQAALAMPAEEYCATVLSAICAAAARDLGHHGIAVDYRELPAAVETRLCPHFGIPPDAAMASVTAMDAKRPHMPFDPAAAARERPVTAAIRAAAERVVRL